MRPVGHDLERLHRTSGVDPSGEKGDGQNLSRRDFLELAGAALALASLSCDPDPHLVPADKHLDPQWVARLFRRGEKEVFSGEALATIGMPCGGIGSGQLYLTGDGTLGCWQIFNDAASNWVGKTGSTWEHTGIGKPVDQGFAVVYRAGGGAKMKRLDRSGFADVTFRGEYPIGTITYREEGIPLDVQMEAFSPFIPLNAPDSALPATLFHVTVRNVSQAPVEVALEGWLENHVGYAYGKVTPGHRVTRPSWVEDRVAFTHSAEDLPREVRRDPDAIQQAADWGTMTLATQGAGAHMDWASSAEPRRYDIREPFVARLRTGAVDLAPGEAHTFTFVLAWHFPNNPLGGREYARRFADATAVANYVLDHEGRLTADTRLWRDTYYDSTLPYWLLDRLHATAGNLATGTCQWWKNGRFWAYEGVASCPGTCTHVWSYAQGHARLFPELARSIREMQDFAAREQGGGFHPDTGLVGFRGDDGYAADGQCGTVLAAYREHLTSASDAFLRRNWPRIRSSLELLIRHDGDGDGLITDSQPNTYDIAYWGANTFVGSLYLAALRAGEEMAREVGDRAFASLCRAIFDEGTRNTQGRLWNGEYFVQDVDLGAHPRDQYKDGCLSDQLFGQGWAHQLGLGYLHPVECVEGALRAVFRYNWAPDVAKYNEVHPPFRWFIDPGQAGLFVCTWPKSEYLPEGTMYRDEVWTGIEYQVAGHMVWEGMLTEALAICRAIHDRYRAGARNPYNEVECGDHYARALASWGVYLALAGFGYHGPRGHLVFDPRITPEDFRAAFTAAEGWGTFEQRRRAERTACTITLRWGTLRIASLDLALPKGAGAPPFEVRVRGTPVHASAEARGDMLRVVPSHAVVLSAGDTLEVIIGQEA